MNTLSPIQNEETDAFNVEWLLRVPLSSLFAFSGITKALDLDAGRAEMVHFGLPEVSIFAIIALQIAGAAALATGWAIRIAAAGLAAFVIAASVLAHAPISDGALDVRQSTTFVEHLVIVGALLLLATNRQAR